MQDEELSWPFMVILFPRDFLFPVGFGSLLFETITFIFSLTQIFLGSRGGIISGGG
jgi:hypothetical protein